MFLSLMDLLFSLCFLIICELSSIFKVKYLHLRISTLHYSLFQKESVILLCIPTFISSSSKQEPVSK